MANGFTPEILLAYHAKRCPGFLQEVFRRSKAKRWDTYQLPNSPPKCGFISFPQLGARLHRSIKPPFEGCVWILVATELFTKWVEVVAMKKATSSSVANFLRENIICHFGVPSIFISNNGTPFLNKDVCRLTNWYSITHMTPIPYYPKGNG